MRVYAVCIGVTPECRQMESEMIGDGWGHVDEVGVCRWGIPWQRPCITAAWTARCFVVLSLNSSMTCMRSSMHGITELISGIPAVCISRDISWKACKSRIKKYKSKKNISHLHLEAVIAPRELSTPPTWAWVDVYHTAQQCSSYCKCPWLLVLDI